MHVHLLHPPDPVAFEKLITLLDTEISLTTGEIQPEHSSAAVLVAGRPTYEELLFFKDLKILVVPWTGIPPETLEAVKRVPDIKLCNLHHNAVPVAEMALALLLAVAKKVIPFDQQLRRGNWELRYQEPEVSLLAGKRALIVGYGVIGRRIGTILKALDVQVKSIRRTSGANTDPDVYTSVDLLGLLPETDILILALPLTDDTEELIGEKELALLSDPAILINISRGKVVDQKALFEALSDRRLFGAGLDVWYNYPANQASRADTYPGDFPFQELENLVLSPHRAGLVRETESLRMNALADLLNAASRGKQLPKWS